MVSINLKMSHYFILQNRCKCKFVVSDAKSDTEHVSNLDVDLYSEISAVSVQYSQRKLCGFLLLFDRTV